MAKRNKKEKQQPNTIVFLVEGDSDRIALEIPLEFLITEKYPDYNVKFLLQQKYVSPTGEEFDCNDDDDNDYITEDEYISGGDITSNPFTTPENIEQRITYRFIKPAEKAEGLYPKHIAKIIQITDMDGVYVPDGYVKPFDVERKGHDGPYYNADSCVIETDDIDGIIARNERKRRNLDYLLSLTSTGIKVKSKTIPYEIYFFSSNLDHFINNDANMVGGKRYQADRFMRTYGLDNEKFCNYFFQDGASVGKLGYYESWDMIREETNSISRFTNIDCLIRKLMNDNRQE